VREIGSATDVTTGDNETRSTRFDAACVQRVARSADSDQRRATRVVPNDDNVDDNDTRGVVIGADIAVVVTQQ
jgi:hypothetical protein